MVMTARQNEWDGPVHLQARGFKDQVSGSNLSCEGGTIVLNSDYSMIVEFLPRVPKADGVGVAMKDILIRICACERQRVSGDET